MPKIHFVEGTAQDYSVTHDFDWPVISRVGEFLSLPADSGDVADWEVMRVCHIAEGKQYLRTLVWIEASGVKPLGQAMGFHRS